MDVDDLDANLFNSFSTNRRRPSQEKKPAKSAASSDIDDLDANLFNSFNTNRRRSSSEKKSAKSETVAASADIDDLDTNLFSSIRSSRRRPSQDKIGKGVAKQPEPDKPVQQQTQLKPPASQQKRDEGIMLEPSFLSSPSPLLLPSPPNFSTFLFPSPFLLPLPQISMISWISCRATQRLPHQNTQRKETQQENKANRSLQGRGTKVSSNRVKDWT